MEILVMLFLQIKKNKKTKKNNLIKKNTIFAVSYHESRKGRGWGGHN